MTTPRTPASNCSPCALNSRIRRPKLFASRELSIIGSPKPRLCIPPAAVSWWKETALAPGTYEYCLVVDGQWMPDPLAREIRGQSVRRQKLDFACGQFAGSRPPRRRGKFTVEKHKQTKNKKNMSKETQAVTNDIGQLAEDARALMSATADVAGEKVGEARKRLAAALERAKQIGACVRDKAVAGAKASRRSRA